MKIVVIISANAEWRAVSELYPGLEIQHSPFGEFSKLTLDTWRLTLFHGGWGKISAAASTQYVIDHFQPDLLVNLGTCGGFAGRIEVGTIMLVERTLVYDIIEQMGDTAEAIAHYATDIDLSWIDDGQRTTNHGQSSTVCGLLVSADRDIIPEDISPPPISYDLPMSSAQVKSAILLAGLYAGGRTMITEPAKSRDHTERMLPAFGADLKTDGLSVSIHPGKELHAQEIDVPGDFSSAAFIMVAALLIPGAEVMLKNVGINPTRTGLIDVLRSMGAHIDVHDVRSVSGEPVADIFCKGQAGLKAITVTAEMVPSLIDEFPILCIAAARAEGTTIIRGAEELRLKESDRIKAMALKLSKMGVAIEEFPDGISITGEETLSAAAVDSHGDHRIAMSMAVAGLIAEGATAISNASSVAISFPDFFTSIRRLTA